MKVLVALIVLFGVGCLYVNSAVGGSASARPLRNVSAASAATRCDDLLSADLSEVRDAPTQVTGAALVGAKRGKADTPAHCEIQGYVAPDVGFALWLPADRWNGKLLELGCGGSCGSTEHVAGCSDPVRRGYACIVSDGGHKSNGTEMKWAYNRPQAAIEYVIRASHVTAIAGKAIVARYYGQTPRSSYFMGCSAGGLQAMGEAQRFPWDFNGIVAGAPDIRLSAVWVNWLWGNRALVGTDGRPLLSNADFELLHHAVVTACDLNDGVKDGVIGDPRKCDFDPRKLQCAAGKSPACLSKSQIDAVEKVYSGPHTSDGERIAQPIALRGSELNWSVLFEGSSKYPTPAYRYFRDWFNYSIFAIHLGSGWKTGDFNFDRDYKRLGAMEALEPINADLRAFKSSGGKLLAYTGWNDAGEGVLNTIDYYETAERVIGGRTATQDFFRLFVIPGMNHCTTGDGAFAVDYLSYLDAWVENGKAPDKIIGYHVKLSDLMNRVQHGDESARNALERRLEFPLASTTVKFSRPIYPYPIETKYLGRGDPDQARNFGPVHP